MISKEYIVKQINNDWSKELQPYTRSNYIPEICIAILNYLYHDSSSLSYITYGSLRKVVGESYCDKDLLEAIQYLCGNRTHLLEAKFEIVEPDNHIDIPDCELNKAYKTGQLLHPETGELISDFEEQVSMYFQPSPLVKSLT